MEKKRPVGILIVGITGIILGFIKLRLNLSLLPGLFFKQPLISVGVIFSASILFSSIFILKHRNWARLLFIYQIMLYSISRLCIKIIAAGFATEQSRRIIYGNKFIFTFFRVLDQPCLTLIPWWFSIILFVIVVYYLTLPEIRVQFR